MNQIEDVVQRLARATRELAMVGASVRLRAAGAEGLIADVVHGGARAALGGVEPTAEEGRGLLPMIDMALKESGELLSTPDRSTWQVEDDDLLRAQGAASAGAFDRILRLAAQRPSLEASLHGRFLDVGTGVGGIALRAAERCPALSIDAIDIWDPALALAEQAIRTSPHSARIRLQRLDVTALPPGAGYTLVWLPTMFMTKATVDAALERIVAASSKASWLIAPVYTIPADPVAAAFSKLRTLRSGGEMTDPSDVREMLTSHGYTHVEIDEDRIATFVLGRLPERPPSS